MDYKQGETPTGIHTRIDANARISSTWRTFANSNFETRAWETFLWVDEKLTEQYDTLRNADDVVNLHLEIMNGYKAHATADRIDLRPIDQKYDV